MFLSAVPDVCVPDLELPRKQRSFLHFFRYSFLFFVTVEKIFFIEIWYIPEVNSQIYCIFFAAIVAFS